jgi:hypothetical protein
MSDEERALQPIDQRTVDFYGDELTAVLVEVEEQQKVYVPVKPICDFLGVDWEGQRQRIGRDAVLSEVAMSAFITQADIEEGSRRPHRSAMLCLPLDYLNGWMFGINAARVKTEVRERLIRY